MSKLNDKWQSRDFPTLIATAELLEDGALTVQAHQIANRADLSVEDVIKALSALDGPYVIGKPADDFGGRSDYLVNQLTERGRRAVGLWPDDAEVTESLVSLLRQAEEQVDDPEEKTLLRRASGALGSVSQNVMSDVLAAFVRQQTGL